MADQNQPARTDPRPRRSQTLTRLALGGAMAFAGISHLATARQEFQAQVPDWFPVSKDLVVLGSGVAEIGLGAALLALTREQRKAYDD